jgi:hypothetical protein
VVVQKEAEEQKEVAAQKVKAEWRDRLAQEKVAQEAAAAEEQWQLLSKGLSCLTLTSPAPSSIWFINSVKGEEEGDRRGFVGVPVHFVYSVVVHCRLFLEVEVSLLSIASVLCLTELQKNGMRRMLCDQCWQWKMACHWDLMGIKGPQDPITSKQACRPIKEPVIDMDDLEDAGDMSLPSPVADIVSSFFALRNAANALVTESVRGHLSVSLLHISSPTLQLCICIHPPHLCTILKDYTHSR